MKRQQGFTLPELLIVGVIGLIFVGILLAIIRPNDFAAEKRNAERRTHLASLMQAISEYHKEKGDIPPSITAEETLIASPQEGLGLCGDLVPSYLNDLPKDPSLGVMTMDGEDCTQPDQIYSIGYAAYSEGGRVILTAPAAEKDETIKVEKWFSLL